MAKKENAKAGKKSKLEAAVTEAEKDSVNPVAEEIKAEAPKTVEESVETPVQAEPTEAVQEEQAGEIGERAPVEEAVEERAPAEEAVEECAPAEEAVEAPAFEQVNLSPRRSVAFIGSECYPFVKTGGLGDVMYALPKALVKQNCDVKVILPRYKCIPWEYQQKMIYRGSFGMDLCADGRSYYVGIMEYVWDGVVYDFIDNEEFFSYGNPYTNLIDDIPKYCYFAKAALAALNYMDWIPDRKSVV